MEQGYWNILVIDGIMKFHVRSPKMVRQDSRVPQTMVNIATAITNKKRLDSGQKIQGTAIALESYIHVLEYEVIWGI